MCHGQLRLFNEIFSRSDFGSDDDDEKLRSVNNDGSSNDNSNDNVKICGFEDLIPFVNMLQSVFLVNSDLKDVVKLPQLVIVGSQVCTNLSIDLPQTEIFLEQMNSVECRQNIITRKSGTAELSS